MLFRWHVSTFDLRVAVHAEDGEPDLLVVEAVVDGELLPYDQHGPIDLRQLEACTQATGNYFIWTCECGDAGCAGRFKGVEVVLKGDHANWRDLDLRKRYRFLQSDVVAALPLAKAQLEAHLAGDPTAQVCPA